MLELKVEYEEIENKRLLELRKKNKYWCYEGECLYITSRKNHLK